MGKAEVVLLAGASLWGLGWMPLQYLAGLGLAGMPLVLVTYSVLSLVALPLIWRQRAGWLPQWRAFLAIGLFGGWATAGLVGALSEGDVVRAMLLFYLAPVWGVLGSWLALGERLTPLRVGALLLAMLGIGLTLGVSGDTFEAFTTADWLALSAGLAFAINNLATRAADKAPVMSKALVGFVGSAVLGGLFCLLEQPTLPSMTPGLWGTVVLFGLFWLASMSAAQYGFSHVEAGRAAVLVVIELVVAVLTAAWFGDRELGLREWRGGTLVLLAALIAARPPRESPLTLCETKP